MPFTKGNNTMKKLLLILLCLPLMSHAQLSPGSNAPDFTITDINGQSHSIQEYLDDGYSVVIDMSATWASPSWSF